MNLTKISMDIVIKGKIRKEMAWEIITNASLFSQTSNQINRVVTVEKDHYKGKSEWYINIDGAPLYWISKDTYNHGKYQYDFKSINGDFEELHGSWRIDNYENMGIRLSFEINYHLGIPVIEEHVGPILKEKLGKFMHSILDTIKTKLLEKQIENRKNKRKNIGKFFPLVINSTGINVFIFNISQCGIMFEYDENLIFSKTTMRIGNVTIDSAILTHKMNRNSYRVLFSEPLSDYEFDKLIHTIQENKSVIEEVNQIKNYSVVTTKHMHSKSFKR